MSAWQGHHGDIQDDLATFSRVVWYQRHVDTVGCCFSVVRPATEPRSWWVCSAGRWNRWMDGGNSPDCRPGLRVEGVMSSQYGYLRYRDRGRRASIYLKGSQWVARQLRYSLRKLPHTVTPHCPQTPTGLRGATDIAGIVEIELTLLPGNLDCYATSTHTVLRSREGRWIPTVLLGARCRPGYPSPYRLRDCPRPAHHFRSPRRNSHAAFERV